MHGCQRTHSVVWPCARAAEASAGPAPAASQTRRACSLCANTRRLRTTCHAVTHCRTRSERERGRFTYPPRRGALEGDVFYSKSGSPRRGNRMGPAFGARGMDVAGCPHRRTVHEDVLCGGQAPARRCRRFAACLRSKRPWANVALFWGARRHAVSWMTSQRYVFCGRDRNSTRFWR